MEHLITSSIYTEIFKVSITFDMDHSAVGVVFNADHPLVLTDDVKLKFYCSNVSIHKSFHTSYPLNFPTEISSNWL